jgi:hypothetical protein
LLAGRPLRIREDNMRGWYDAAEGPFSRFLDATVAVLWSLSTPVELRVQLSETLLTRLADAARVKEDELSSDDAGDLSAEASFRLAKFFAEKDDRAGVLRAARMALNARRPGVTPVRFREDDSFKGWNGDEEFLALYKQFEPPPKEPKDSKEPKSDAKPAG